MSIRGSEGGVRLMRRQPTPLPSGNAPGVSVRRSRSESRIAFAFLAPALVILVMMTIAAGIYVLYVSFFRVGTFGAPNQFVGGQNYSDAFTVNNFGPDLIRTVLYVVVAVSIELVAGLMLGLALARPSRANKVAAAFFVIPFAATPAVSALVARVLLDPNYGWIDYYLRRIGITSQPIQWLSHPTTAWVALIGLDVWQWTPFVALIILAGVQSLRTDVLEAAQVDGARTWATFRYIRLPMLAPFIAIAAVLRVIQAFKTFDIFLILTNGGPGTSTEVVNLNLYRIVMQDFSVGSGAAIAVMLLILLLTFTPLLLRTVGSHAEHERGE